ncbi:MAG: HAD-IA family hydrolase [Pseudomonadota bacterium]
MRTDALVVLDFDGTLVDLNLPREWLKSNVGRLLADAGAQNSLVPFLPGIEEALVAVSRRNAQEAEELRTKIFALITEADVRGARESSAVPGVREFLGGLRGRRILLYSNNCREAVREGLRRAGLAEELFWRMVTREEERSLKPSGRPILEAMDELGTSAPEEVFVIGDHPYDILSAVEAQALLGDRARVVPVGRYRDRHRARNLETAGAWFLIRDLEEALPLLTTEPRSEAVSLVLLAYNEEKAVAAAVEDAQRFLSLYAPNFEVLVVDDGSRDGTATILESLARPRLRVITHARNEGMGTSARDGYRAAQGEYLAHLPGDRQVRSQSLIHFLPAMAPRTVVLSTYENPPSGLRRQLISRIFRGMVRWVAGLNVDFAGTYLFHRDLLNEVNWDRAASDTFVFSFELLEAFQKSGCSFERVRIRTYPREDGGSREDSLRRIGKVFWELIRSRIRSVRHG